MQILYMTVATGPTLLWCCDVTSVWHNVIVWWCHSWWESANLFRKKCFLFLSCNICIVCIRKNTLAALLFVLIHTLSWWIVELWYKKFAQQVLETRYFKIKLLEWLPSWSLSGDNTVDQWGCHFCIPPLVGAQALNFKFHTLLRKTSEDLSKERICKILVD